MDILLWISNNIDKPVTLLTGFAVLIIIWHAKRINQLEDRLEKVYKEKYEAVVALQPILDKIVLTISISTEATKQHTAMLKDHEILTREILDKVKELGFRRTLG